MYKKIFLKAGALICVFFIMCLLCMPSVNAVDKGNNLEIYCNVDGISIDGLNWSVYYVGEKNQQGVYMLSGEFSGYPVSLENLTEDNIQNVADTLENYAKIDKITKDYSTTTNQEGKGVLNLNKSGLYLLSGEQIEKNGKKYIPSAFLVEILNDKESPVTIYPKFSVTTVPGEPNTPNDSSSQISQSLVEYSVTKKWVGDEKYQKIRPAYVKAEIYRNSELYKTVTLNNSNNWTYSWTDRDNYQWAVKEIEVNKYYKVVYKNLRGNYEIINTLDEKAAVQGGIDGGKDSDSSDGDDENGRGDEDSRDDDKTTDSKIKDTNSQDPHSNNSNKDGENLPQTGQLWWPVPVLATVGLLLVAVGIRMGSCSSESAEKSEKRTRKNEKKQQ